MMPEVDIDVSIGPVSVITVLDTATSELVVSGAVQLMGWSLRTTSVQASRANENSIVSPGAFATIAQVALPAGEWSIAWTVEVSGTVGAPEVNNFSLSEGVSTLSNSVNGNSAGLPYPQAPFVASVPVAGATVLVQCIAAGTVGATYSVTLTASPVGAVAIAELTSGGSPVAEVSLPVGGHETVSLMPSGIDLHGDLSLSVLSGSFRGAVYVRLLCRRDGR